jgi:cytochrome d ubiquinol oxidase subunit II
MFDLNITWFILFTVLITGYAVLDGFDLGVGILHLFAKDENERRNNINLIAPVWDGNEVWLLTGGGALFAAFPVVYATVFSGFYLALILLLLALIFRAVSIEFRSKLDSQRWKRAWDYGFGIGSLLPSILFGVAVGNIIRGLPINEKGMFTGSFLGLLNPYSILIGLLSCTLFIMHGSIYLAMKTEGDQKSRAISIVSKTWVALIVLYIAATLLTMVTSPFMFEGLFTNPVFWLLFIFLLSGIIYIPIALEQKNTGKAFLSSSVIISCMIGLLAVGLFPRLVPSITDLNYSFTIYNASSTPRTLLTMLVIALIGMPLVIGYTIFIYRVFKGKVVIDEESY